MCHVISKLLERLVAPFVRFDTRFGVRSFSTCGWTREFDVCVWGSGSWRGGESLRGSALARHARRERGYVGGERGLLSSFSFFLFGDTQESLQQHRAERARRRRAREEEEEEEEEEGAKRLREEEEKEGARAGGGGRERRRRRARE